MTEQNFRVSVGRSWPLGVTLTETGANVAVWAPDATLIELCVFTDAEEEQRIAVPYRDGGVWYAHVEGITQGTRYGLRATGPHQPENGLRFNPAKLLIDPYAKALTGPVSWDGLMNAYAVGPGDDMVQDDRDSAPVIPKAIVQGPAEGPDPQTNRPIHPWSDTVIYEAHVKGLTQQHPDIPEDIRGTYAALAHPVIVEHLQKLGVTALELLPIQTFIDDEFLVRQYKRNYWGYQPVAWQAPEPRYAHRDADAEIRHAVHTLHEAGIEVILDIVFNHTGEGSEMGPTLSYRALNNAGYYQLTDGGRHYVDVTGTGNSLNPDSDMVIRLVLDSMRHWVTRYGIDGFRFDLASTLGRTEDHFTPNSPFFYTVRQDPLLAGVKLIAEPWDLGIDGYQLGHYPYPWKEWNDSYRDKVRRAWRGESLGTADMGSCLTGSANLFDHSGRSASSSINFLTAHDGFTLNDVVSYNDKHNEANGEDNRDGHNENVSDNMGAEGLTDDPTINEARERRIRGMLTTLFVSQGVPMLLAGDELRNSQGGNNNAYAQDNEIGWIDWTERSQIEFISRLTAMRARLPLLRQRNFLHGGTREDGHIDIQWFKADGQTPTDDDWHDPELTALGVEIRGVAGYRSGEELTGCVFLILNVGDETEVALPTQTSWHLELDSTDEDAHGDFTDHYVAPAQSVIVLSSP